MQRIICYLSLLSGASLACAPQPAKQPEKVPQAAQEKPRQPLKCERAAWNSDRDYEHYIACLREYADSLKDDMSPFGRSESERVTIELALIEQLKQQAAALKANADTQSAVVELARNMLQDTPKKNNQQPSQAQQQTPPASVENKQSNAPAFTMRATLNTGQEVILHCTVSGQGIQLVGISPL